MYCTHWATQDVAYMCNGKPKHFNADYKIIYAVGDFLAPGESVKYVVAVLSYTRQRVQVLN